MGIIESEGDSSLLRSHFRNHADLLTKRTTYTVLKPSSRQMLSRRGTLHPWEAAGLLDKSTA